jgi:hypothetical protein
MHATLAPLQQKLSAAIHEGLVDGLKMPADDLFQIFRLHEPGDLVYTKTFPNADRTDIVFIQILLANLYGPEEKKRMYDAVTSRIVGVGIKQDNILIAVTENGGADWHAPEKDAQA